MNRGLSLKCLHCDRQEFHILYEMGSPPGGVPQPRPSGRYECVRCGKPRHDRDAFGAIDEDQLFAPLFPARGQPAASPWRLALAYTNHERHAPLRAG
jgi:hypothetical protein